MSTSPSIILRPRGAGIHADLSVPVPSREVISTSLVVSADATRLPTLLSVERIVGRLAGLGLVLSDTRERGKIAYLVNRSFLAVPPENWMEQELPLHVSRADGQGGPESLRAVDALRKPVLFAADAAIGAGGSYGSVDRRASEIRLVDDLTQAVETRKPVWSQFGKTAVSFLGATVLTQLVEDLIGVPLVDIIRSTLGGAGRLVL